MNQIEKDINGNNNIDNLLKDNLKDNLKNSLKQYSELKLEEDKENSENLNNINFINNKRNRSNNYSAITSNNMLLKTSPKNKSINEFFKPCNSIKKSSNNTSNKAKKLPNNKEESLSNNSSNIILKEIIKEKENELSILKAELQSIKNNNTNNKIKEIIIKNLLEINENTRKNTVNYISEQQKKLGKFCLIKTSQGQLIEKWEDGEDLSHIKNRIIYIKNELSNNTSTLSSLQILLYKKELDFLIKKYEILSIKKSEYLCKFRLYQEEINCDYYSKWPLLKDRYQLLSLLGKGGYSEVYKAYDLVSNKYVACKIFKIESNWTSKVIKNYMKHTLREINIGKILNDNINIIKQFDSFDISDKSYCCVLEYCKDGDLLYLLNTYKKLPENITKEIIKQILNGLKFLSCNNANSQIIHYDLKPSNILFNDGVVKISDFGVSKIIDNSNNVNNSNINFMFNNNFIELTSQGIGTYQYLPPECFKVYDEDNGENNNNKVFINNKVDIWSVGIITYELLYGKRPFGNEMSSNALFEFMKNNYYKIQNNHNDDDNIYFNNLPKINFTDSDNLNNNNWQSKIIIQKNTNNDSSDNEEMFKKLNALNKAPTIISSECKEFIEGCLQWNINKRFDINQAINNKFISRK